MEESTPLGPGGVSANLALWLKADADTTLVSGDLSGWADQSTVGNDAVQSTASARPTFIESDANYNPAFNFDGNDYLSIPFNTTFNDLSAFWIADVDGGDGTFRTPWSSRGGFNGHFMYVNASNEHTYWNGDLPDQFYQDPTGEAPTENYELMSLVGDENAGTVTKTVYRQGIEILPSIDRPFTPNTTTDIYIGAGCNDCASASFFWNGDIAEVVLYNSALSATDQRKVQSYMAIKYGSTLGSTTDTISYLNSSGDTIWKGDTIFQNDIIGIMKDDASNLLQKQSRSENDSLRIFLSSLETSNVTNTGTFTNDLSSIVVGHDNGKLKSSVAASAESPAGIVARMDRIWKVTNTNFADSYSLEIEWDSSGSFDINDIRLLVDDDDDFSDATILGTGDGLTFSLGSIIVSGINTTHIPLGSTRYITIGSVSASTTLPIQLVEFSAHIAHEMVKLDWITSTELNNDYFSVQRSATLENWEDIATINGAGNSSSWLYYDFVDHSPLEGVSYYRLKQTDYNGDYTHSPIRVIDFNNIESSGISVYPNPTSQLIVITGDAPELSNVIMYSSKGVDVTKLVKIINRDESSLVIDLSQLSNGAYTIITKSTSTNISLDR